MKLFNLRDFEYVDPGFDYPAWKLAALNRLKNTQVKALLERYLPNVYCRNADGVYVIRPDWICADAVRSSAVPAGCDGDLR